MSSSRRQRRLIFIVSLVIGGVVTLRPIIGCSGSDSPAGAAADASSDASILADADSSSAGDALSDTEPPDPERPDGLPAGWELERRFDKLCRLYVPTTRELLPPPLTWEDCPSIAKPSGVKCQLLSSTPVVQSATLANGKVILTLRAGGGPQLKANYWMVAEVDGPVHTAIVSDETSVCGLVRSEEFDGRYVVYINSKSDFHGGGLFASDIDDLAPRVVLHLNEQTHSLYAPSFAILDLATGFVLDQYSWTDGAPLPRLWSAAQDNGLDQGPFAYAKNALFWSADNLNIAKVNVYTPTSGVRDFLSDGLVTTTSGHDDLGTDEHDLVWIHAHGRTSGDATLYDAYDIMTAPYTTDPTAVQMRRLRSETGPTFGTSPFVVGCGYAARGNASATRIVRLLDGQSWVLPSVSGSDWVWSRPFAVTCDEVFAQVGVVTNGKQDIRFARVRLDSLGPGIPAD